MRFALDNPNTYQLVFCGSRDVISSEKQAATAELGDRCFAEFSGPIHEIAAAGSAWHRLARRRSPGAVGRLSWTCGPADHHAGPQLGAARGLMKVTLEGLLHGLVTD